MSLPPGKNDDIGDRLCWVGLLNSLPENALLHIVSDDTDYRNEGFSDGIHIFGVRMETKEKGEIKLWDRISQFLTATFQTLKMLLRWKKLFWLKIYGKVTAMPPLTKALAN